MLNLLINEVRELRKGNIKIVLTVKTAQNVVNKIIGDTYKSIDDAVDYLSKEGIDYASNLSDEGKVSINFVNC